MLHRFILISISAKIRLPNAKINDTTAVPMFPHSNEKKRGIKGNVTSITGGTPNNPISFVPRSLSLRNAYKRIFEKKWLLISEIKQSINMR